MLRAAPGIDADAGPARFGRIRGRRRRRTLAVGLAATGLVATVVIGAGGPTSEAEAEAEAEAAADTERHGRFAPIALDQTSPPGGDLAAFLDRSCLGCHATPEPEGGLDLMPLFGRLGRVAGGGEDAAEIAAAQVAADRAGLRSIRARLVDRSMPPSRRKPSDERYAAAIADLDRVLETLTPVFDPAALRRGTVRRLTRVEYANAVRDLFGVDFDPAWLPPDEIGHGFDTNGDVAAMPPLRLEQSLDAAERVAAAAVTSASMRGAVRRRAGADLEVQGQGRVVADGVHLHSRGAGVARFTVPVAGTYRVRVVASGMQAGPEPVRVELRAGPRSLGTFDVVGNRERNTLEASVALEPGTIPIGGVFVNDYYAPKAADPAERDRNAAVHAIELVGPRRPADPSPFQRAMADRHGDLEPDARWRAAVRTVAELAWRRPLTDAEASRLEAAVESAVAASVLAEAEAAGDGSVAATAGLVPASPPIAALPDDPAWRGMPDPARLRTAIVAVLAHPRFLFHLEAEPAPGDAFRPVDPYEDAARLAAFLWSSVPDADLAAAAANGSLGRDADRRAMIRRLLDDPRSLALAEHFAVQWLQIRQIDERRPDPDRFPEVDAALQDSMRSETVLFFDAVVREKRPVSHLLTAQETFLDERLARHYGIAGVRGPHMRRVSLSGLAGVASRPPRTVEVDADAGHAGDRPPTGLGVLRHGSVLLTTSNPTRTSPVKRGKWVLEALLDDPPPPAPAFVPALPGDGAASADASLRELLEQHREDPNCAGCHRRMDPLGFALEPFDAVGRPRAADPSGAAIDASAEMPGGLRFIGPEGLRDLLVGPRSDDFVRALLRHLSMYAFGRGLDAADEAWIDSAIEALGPDPALADVVLAVTEAPPFRLRLAAPAPHPPAAETTATAAPSHSSPGSEPAHAP